MIKTLWTLKNMDKIQNDAHYGNNGWGPSPFYSFVTGSHAFYVLRDQMLNSRPGQVIQYNPKKAKTLGSYNPSSR
jgi:hypothetical protein